MRHVLLCANLLALVACRAPETPPLRSETDATIAPDASIAPLAGGAGESDAAVDAPIANDASEPDAAAISASNAAYLAALPPRPKLPWSAARACGRDDDCAFEPIGCAPPPCNAVWVRAANKSTVRQLEALQRLRSCPPTMPPPCPSIDPPPGTSAPQARGFLGTRAICERGQCVPIESFD